MASLFKILQVEVSTRCNARCAMCPRTLFRDEWISRDMDVDLFRKVVDEISHRLDLVHLQGWGEPLLHPNIKDVISYVKRRLDVRVSLTTNATLLTERRARELLEAGLDVIAVSLAGSTEATHNRLRAGCDFRRVVESVRTIVRLRRELRSDVRVVVSYLMVRQNVHELEELVRLCHDLGVDEIVINNITYIPSRELHEWRAFSCFEWRSPEAIKHIERARELAERLGVRLYAYGAECAELAVCPEMPTISTFVSASGDVSPCVYTNLPTRGDRIRRFFAGREISVRKVVFGSVRYESIYDIWSSRRYREFREVFERRIRLTERSKLMPELDELMIASTSLPDCCRTCYRMYGV